MATNKRKDAAALFELLDNSTLKVPKNAGSLKIPTWWSSKTNPAPERIDADMEHDDGGVAVISATRSTAPAPSPAPVRTVAAPDNAARPLAAGALHQRLFVPPPVTQTPAATPSIRPPGAIPAEPFKAAPPATAATAPMPSTQAAAASPALAEDSVAPRDPRVFTPQTYAQKRKQWVTPKPGAFARLPAWVLPVGLGAIVLLIGGTMIAAHRRDNKASAAPVTDHPTAADAARAAAAAARGPGTVPAYTPLPVPTANHAAQVYGPGQVARTPDQYYIIVAQTPSKTVAEKNAKFLADHGIDVSTEIDDRSGMYVIISVQGFPSVTAAKPYKDRIIEIGHLTAEYKRSPQKGGWDTPAVLNGLRMTVAAQ